MRSTDVFCFLIVATLAVLLTLGRAESNDDIRTLKPCNTSELTEQCGKNQRCSVVSSGKQLCQCQRDFNFVNGECIRVSSTTNVDVTTLKPEQRSESGGSSVAAGLLIPTFLIVVGILLYFGARRYKWLQRFRQYRHNRYGNVIVTRDDDDDDDPPIA
ncbi:PREDICTED: uncharacterized protein LOC108777401 [Cyphomyrmex costatus]|uniref:EGF-like domain-containing protein n=1 Tax=Cyphomyrmex costatus TaxID=456900 RepID=A0A195CEM2_9HYME|nr:PREDICTED: uncharacterized protein LOC108777401 [Cyphomyrmex costatus]KYM98671.1 hypothetical protein ALC62_10639 [Cyphomyrmex costatus]